MIVVQYATIRNCYSLFLVVYSSLDLCSQCSLPICSILNKGYLSVSKDMLYENIKTISNAFQKEQNEYKYITQFLHNAGNFYLHFGWRISIRYSYASRIFNSYSTTDACHVYSIFIFDYMWYFHGCVLHMFGLLEQQFEAQADS